MSTPFDPVTAFRGTYNDGQTAATYPVVVHVEDARLLILGEDGVALGRWAWDDLRLAEPAAADRPIRLSSRAKAGARLTLDDPAAIAALRPRARYLIREPFTRTRVYRAAGIGAACAAAILFFVYGLPLIAKPAASLVPVSWETSVGDSTVEIVNNLFADGRPLCSDAAGVAALETLTGKLDATTASPYQIRVDVADSGLVNALAAPGGRIVLFRGLIERAKSPDEVAGVLAHEMAHVIHRHPTQGMISTIGWSSLLAVFTGGASLSNEAVARLAAHLATSAYTRDLEAEADRSATEMLTAAGIGSAGLVNFFRAIQRQEAAGLSLPAYLSTHPQTEDRIAAIERHASKGAAPALSDADWQALKGICRGSNG